MADKYSNIPVPTPTNKPVPSTDIRDHVFGGAKIDEFVTSLQKTYTDRFGRPHFTIEGLRWVAQQAIASFGYILVDSFQAGATLSLPNQALRNTANGEYYRWDGPLPKTVPAGSTPQTTGGIGAGAWLGVGSAVLSSSQDGAGDELVAVKQPFPGSVPGTVHNKMKQIVSLRDFGSTGDGVTDSLASVNAAIASFGYSGNGQVYVDEGMHVVSAEPTNPYGVEFIGPGMIGIPDNFGGHHRINSYADKHKICIGKEYLFAFYNAMRTDPATPGGRLNCILAGDSTMHGGNGEPIVYQPDVLMTRLFRRSGLPNMGIINRAVPSTSWKDMDILADLGAQTRLLIIKYGVNDGYGPKETRHQAFQAAMNAKLAEVRAHPWGGFKSLSIVIMGPNATNDPEYYRDEEWYESIRGIHVAAARKYGCVYFDSYGMMPDSRRAAGNDMDQPWPTTKPGVAVHPLAERNAWMYGQLFNEIFSAPMLMNFCLNTWQIIPLHVESITPTTLPTANEFSCSENWHQVNVANGWPVSGLCNTQRHADGLIAQTVFDQASSRVIHRSSPIGATTWNAMTGVPVAVVLGNSWVAAGANYNAPAVIITMDGTATLRGAIRSGVASPGTAMFTIPAGFRPLRTSRHVVPTGVGVATAIIELTPNGQATIVGGADNALLFLEGVTYSV